MKPPETTIAYFRGVSPGTRTGYGFYRPGMRHAPQDGPVSPWFDHRYGHLGSVQSLEPMETCWDLERDGHPEAQARFAREDGWTLVTLWDRSGDPRGTCHSVFAIQRDLSDDDALALARTLFPKVFARIDRRLERLGIVLGMGAGTCPLCRQSLAGVEETA